MPTNKNSISSTNFSTFSIAHRPTDKTTTSTTYCAAYKFTKQSTYFHPISTTVFAAQLQAFFSTHAQTNYSAK
jgi:hypothetical protein